MSQELDASSYVIKKMEKRVDKTIKYIMVSGKKALEDAGLAPDSDQIKELVKGRCGVLMSTAMGGMLSFETAVAALESSGGWEEREQDSLAPKSDQMQKRVKLRCKHRSWAACLALRRRQ